MSSILLQHAATERRAIIGEEVVSEAEERSNPGAELERPGDRPQHTA